MSNNIIPAREVAMDEAYRLRLRCCKFPYKLLREQDQVRDTLLTYGWEADLLNEHLAEAIQFAEDARRAYLEKRRARRAAERAADKAWLEQRQQVAA